jgi:phosphoglycolate phosphatase
MRKLLLFDIDGTLVLTGRAGLRAMVRAFKELFGHDDPFDSTSMAGRTDTFLLSHALKREGLAVRSIWRCWPRRSRSRGRVARR